MDHELKIFHNVANILDMVGDEEKVWSAARKAKLYQQPTIADIHPKVYMGVNSNLGDYVYEYVINDMKYYLNLDMIKEEQNLSEETLSAAAKIYIYIIAPPETNEILWQRKYQYILEHYSIQKILRKVAIKIFFKR